MNSKEWKKWLFWFSFAVATIVVYKTIDSVGEIFSFFGNFFNILMPFLMAVLMAYILYIPCKSLEKTIEKCKFNFIKKHARGLSIILVYLLLILLIFVVFNFIIPTVRDSIMDLANNVPNYYNKAIEYIEDLDEDSYLYQLNLNGYVEKVKEFNIVEEIGKYISPGNIIEYVKGIVGSIGIVFDIFVTVVVSIYMLMERNDIKSFLQNLSKAIFDKKTDETIRKYYTKTNSIFFSYITGQIVDAFAVGIITSIAMSIMHVKYSVLLGFLIGIFNIIPYFGAIVAVAFAIIVTIFTGGVAQAIWVAIVVIALQQIDANIINPKILGNSLNLSPILIIFAVTIGGTYFGVLGMFLGVPVVAFLKLIIEDFIEIRNKKKIDLQTK